MSAAGDPQWGITPRAFQLLLSRLSPDSEAAAQEYERLRRALLNFFAWRRCPQPSTCVDDTLDRVARRLDEGEEIGYVQRYIYGVARRVAADCARRRTREQKAVEGWAALRDAAEQGDDEYAACLDRCFPLLPEEMRVLLAGYYEGSGHIHLDGRKRLAERLGISYGTLKVRVHRARVRLERCLRGCLRGRQGDSA